MLHKNGTIWLDDTGNKIQAHGGMILEYEGTWYWYGENKGAPNCPGTTRVDVIGISCYSSNNLMDWHYEGLALSADTTNQESMIAPNKVCERPKVIYSEKLKKFVMWVHVDDAKYFYAGVGVATSDHPVGPFTLIKTIRPNMLESRDMTIFKDLDGTAYLIHSSIMNRTLIISRLTEDYTDVDGFYMPILIDQTREAPAFFYENGQYYMITSGCTSWEANSALYAVCPRLLGQWKLIDNPCEGENYRKTFFGQSCYVFQYKGLNYLMLDHWKPDDLQNSGYSILPIEIQDNRLTVRWQENFILN